MAPNENDPRPEGRSDLLAEILAIIATWRRTILGFAFGVLAVTILVTFLTPSTYVARTTLMPQQEENELGSLSSLVATQFGSFAGGLVGATTSTDILMTIAESRRLRERVIERLDLEKALSVRGRTKEIRRNSAVERLRRMLTLGLSKRLSIFVEARAPSAQLASDIANTFVEELDALNRELAVESVRQKRHFYEERAGEARDSLAAAQVRLEKFQREHGMIALDEQAKAAVEVAARLQGELITLEAQLDVQRRYSSGGFSKTRELEYRVAAIRARIKDLMEGSANGSDNGLIGSFADMPGLGRQLADLMLEAKTHETVYTLMTAQYQQSRIEEARNMPTVQVLDPAMPPPYRDAPRRKMNLLVGLVTGLGGGFLLAMTLEYLHRTAARPAVRAGLDRLGSPWNRIPGAIARLRAS